MVAEIACQEWSGFQTTSQGMGSLVVVWRLKTNKNHVFHFVAFVSLFWHVYVDNFGVKIWHWHEKSADSFFTLGLRAQRFVWICIKRNCPSHSWKYLPTLMAGALFECFCVCNPTHSCAVALFWNNSHYSPRIYETHRWKYLPTLIAGALFECFCVCYPTHSCAVFLFFPSFLLLLP